jgi:hypothetical protein
LPSVARLVTVDEVLRQPVQLGHRALHRALVLADVAAELLADEHQLFLELLELLARGVVLVHAGEPEVAQRLLDVVLGLGVGEVMSMATSAS